MPDQPALPIYDAPVRRVADTSLEAWRRLGALLKAKEREVFLGLYDYTEQTGYPDATGGELAHFLGWPVTSVRPRLTGLHDKGWLEIGVARASRVSEWKCHPYRCAVPLAAVERAQGRK